MRRISFSTRLLHDFQHERGWAAFSYPAPVLEMCYISFAYDPPVAFRNGSRTVFPIHLPSLRILFVNKISFHPCSSMTHIRHLVLNSCYLEQDLMTSLSGMKTLQRLYIGYPSLRHFPVENTIIPYGERASLLLDSLVEVEVMTELVEVIVWVLH